MVAINFPLPGYELQIGYCSTVSELRSLTPLDTDHRVYVENGLVDLDGGGSFYVWDTTDTSSSDDGYSVLLSSASSAGRWKRGFNGQSVKIKGLYNLELGLANWRASKHRSGKSSAGTGFGGVDVVILGDSVSCGAYASSFLYDTWISRLRNKIQDRKNPSGVQGGMGFCPFHINDNTWTHSDTPGGQTNKTLWTLSNEASWTFGGGSNLQVAMRRAYMATNGANSRARFVWDGGAASAAAKRLQATDIELVTSNFSGDGTLTWDRLTSDAFVVVGAGAATGTINQNGATSYGIHRGRQGSALTKTNANGIQLGQASGTTIIRVDGAIAYCDDWDCGYRIHNLSLNGARADYIAASTSTTAANITNWGSTAPGGTAAGATQAGIFVLGFILNDVGLSATPTISVTDFETYYTTLITTALACSSKPSVLIWIPPCRTNDNTFANYQSYVDVLYKLARKYNCGLWDSWSWLGKGQHSTSVVPNGWSAGDGTHWNDLGSEVWAEMFYQILMEY